MLFLRRVEDLGRHMKPYQKRNLIRRGVIKVEERPTTSLAGS